MTTFAQLKKYAEPEFFPGMRARGFEMYKGWTFARTSARGISLILAFDIQSKVRLRVYPYLWVPELDAHKPNLVFPDGATCYARFITYKVPEWPSSWEIETDAAAIQSLSDLLDKLDQFVLPWASATDNGNDLVQLLTECYAFIEPQRSEIFKVLIDKYGK